MKRLLFVWGAALIIAGLLIIEALTFHFYVNPPEAPTEYGTYVHQFDEHMTSLGYERMPRCYEYIAGDYHALYFGYAYKVGDTFAYVQEFGNSVTMYLPPELNPEEYYTTLFPDVDFHLNQGNAEVYWNPEADMALSIRSQEESLPTDVLPSTLRYSVYLLHRYGDAINAVYENHNSDDFHYYFSCNGPMHILCERVQYADVWITSGQSSVSASTK